MVVVVGRCSVGSCGTVDKTDLYNRSQGMVDLFSAESNSIDPTWSRFEKQAWDDIEVSHQ